MKNSKSLFAHSALILIIGTTLTSQVSLAQFEGVKRTDLQRHDLSIPGREMIQARVEIPVGVTAGKHKHPGEEVVYALEGSLEYYVEGRPPVILKPGDVLFIPAGAVHSVKNVGNVNGAELATYILEKGKPLAVPVK
jgi:quercetin dioxygenase-like cupin family protein